MPFFNYKFGFLLRSPISLIMVLNRRGTIYNFSKLKYKRNYKRITNSLNHTPWSKCISFTIIVYLCYFFFGQLFELKSALNVRLSNFNFAVQMVFWWGKNIHFLKLSYLKLRKRHEKTVNYWQQNITKFVWLGVFLMLKKKFLILTPC